MKIVPFLVLSFLFPFVMHCGKKEGATGPSSSTIVADSICFSRHIEPLLTICANCHTIVQPRLSTTLIGYENIKANIDAIIAATRAGRMPKGGPVFSQGAVDTLSAWRTNGEKVCAP